MNRNRVWLVLIVFVLVIGGFLMFRPKGTQPTQKAAPAVQLATAQRKPFDVHVLVHGRVGPPPGSTASLAFAVPGRIARFLVRVGQRVGAGDALVQLDATTYALAVAQARGDLQAGTYSAQSSLAAAQAQVRQGQLRVDADNAALRREQSLYAAGIAAAKDVAAAQTQLSADRADAAAAAVNLSAAKASATGPARGQALRAQAVLSLAQSDLGYTTLRAPEDGIVVAILKHPGETVDTTTPVIALGPSLEHSATFNVPAQVAARIQEGDRAQGTLVSSGQTFSGRVTAAVPAVDPTTQTATVVIDGVPTTAVSGEAVDATIVVASHLAIVVPTQAIVQDPQTGKSLVFVATNGAQGLTFAPRTVKVGAGDEALTEISSGLRPGERIAAQGAFELLAPARGS